MRWFTRLFGGKNEQTTSKRRKSGLSRTVLMVEVLEDRTAPAASFALTSHLQAMALEPVHHHKVDDFSDTSAGSLSGESVLASQLTHEEPEAYQLTGGTDQHDQFFATLANDGVISA